VTRVIDRETLGKMVFDIGNEAAQHLGILGKETTPWESMPEPGREMCRCIGERIAAAVTVYNHLSDVAGDTKGSISAN
jgi:hypothetical protein